MSESVCKGGACSSKDEKHYDTHHECGCHNHETQKHECGCGHGCECHSHEKNNSEHECGCGHNHHGEHSEHGGHAHVTMTSEEELTLLKQYLENLNTEKELVEKRIQELKKEVKE